MQRRSPSSASSLGRPTTKKRKRDSTATTTPELTIGVDMPLREPPLPFGAMSVAIPSPGSAAASPLDASHDHAATILDQCLQLPKLHLGSSSARASNVRRKFLPLIEPLKYPFHTRPAWCLDVDTFAKPRAVALLDAYKDHELLTTVRLR